MIKHPDWIKDNLTAGDILASAVQDVESEAEAVTFLKAYAAYIKGVRGCTAQEAVRIASDNIGYFAGYYGRDAQRRVLTYYRVEHPIFGRSEPTPEQAFQTGMVMGEAVRTGKPIEEAIEMARTALKKAKTIQHKG